MVKKITVIDFQNKIKGKTYEKRAMQLIKKGRAVKISDDTIALKKTLDEEAVILDFSTNNSNDISKEKGYIILDGLEKPEFDDQYLFDKAKKRIVDKKYLLAHMLLYVVTNIFLLIVFEVVFSYYSEPYFLFFSFCFGGLGVTFHIFNYIFNYFIKSKRDDFFVYETKKYYEENYYFQFMQKRLKAKKDIIILYAIFIVVGIFVWSPIFEDEYFSLMITFFLACVFLLKLFLFFTELTPKKIEKEYIKMKKISKSI